MTHWQVAPITAGNRQSNLESLRALFSLVEIGRPRRTIAIDMIEIELRRAKIRRQFRGGIRSAERGSVMRQVVAEKLAEIGEPDPRRERAFSLHRVAHRVAQLDELGFVALADWLRRHSE